MLVPWKKNGGNLGYRAPTVVPPALYPSKVLMVGLPVRSNFRPKNSAGRPKIDAAFLCKRSTMLEWLDESSFINYKKHENVFWFNWVWTDLSSKVAVAFHIFMEAESGTHSYNSALAPNAMLSSVEYRSLLLKSNKGFDLRKSSAWIQGWWNSR